MNNSDYYPFQILIPVW